MTEAAELEMPLGERPAGNNEPDAQWGLELQNGPGAGPSGRTLWLTLPCRIGRSGTQDLCLNDATISGAHAILANRNGVQVCDLRSTNGTWVNGKRITGWTKLEEGDLVQFGGIACSLVRGGPPVCASTATDCDAESLALSLAQLDRLLAGQLLAPHFQPICFTDSSDAFACEALARSNVMGLGKPALMFTAAAYSQREALLSRLCRQAALESPNLKQRHVFLNSHPKELAGLDEFLESLQELRRRAPHQRLTIEMPELAEIPLDDLQTIRRTTTELEIGLAIDDFGVCASRRQELLEVAPDFVKFDMQLVKQADPIRPTALHIVAALIETCRELGIRPIAKRVETRQEVALLVELGCELGQGYLFGRPC